MRAKEYLMRAILKFSKNLTITLANKKTSCYNKTNDESVNFF